MSTAGDQSRSATAFKWVIGGIFILFALVFLRGCFVSAEQDPKESTFAKNESSILAPIAREVSVINDPTLVKGFSVANNGGVHSNIDRYVLEVLVVAEPNYHGYVPFTASVQSSAGDFDCRLETFRGAKWSWTVDPTRTELTCDATAEQVAGARSASFGVDLQEFVG
ncbi:hypothetical protein [Herbiconiux daphne]|uniref:Uncharacterized protein n=1 Tax=Herbiconiux daphne TaxID=2970914 RepID=A0ABT2H1H8_9MICO|nr:hypothetical protein [Herbiconiux daphne]MCS5733793.1 hypothetical protein [Herbiconiux daphne]